MSREYRTSSAVIGRLVEQLSARGVSFDEIKERVGLSELRPDDPDFSISMTSLLVLWEFAIERTGDPALALKLPRLSSTRTTHFVAQIAVNSRNLREAMQLWAQYAPLISDSDRIELREDGDHAVMIYRNVSPDHQNIWMPGPTPPSARHSCGSTPAIFRAPSKFTFRFPIRATPGSTAGN